MEWTCAECHVSEKAALHASLLLLRSLEVTTTVAPPSNLQDEIPVTT